MAKYILPGIEIFSRGVSAMLIISIDEEMFKKLEKANKLENKIKFGKSEFLLRSLEKNRIGPEYSNYKMTLVSHGSIFPKDLNRVLKQKKIPYTLDIDYNPQGIEHQGYIKYDWVLRKELSKDHYLITRDKLPDGTFLFENLLYKIETYWCKDCHDKHERDILLKEESYKTKKEALNGRRRFIRNWKQYAKPPNANYFG